MNGKGLRWAPLCVTASASALIASYAGSKAEASQTHKLKHGETVAAIARKHHITVHAIALANPGIDMDCVPDGHHLTIPASSRKISVASIAHKTAYSRGDKVSVRRGPGETFHRIDSCIMGQKMIVSGERDGWAHVTLNSGQTGWVRHDFLKYAHGGVASGRSSAHSHSKVGAQAAARRAHHQHMVRLLAKLSAKKHALKLAHSAKHHPSHSLASASHRHTKIAHNAKHGHHYVGEASRPNTDSSLVRTAIAYRGTPYRYGSTGGGSFDCSGFTRFVYGRGGVSLPRCAKEQFHSGQSVSKGAMKPGDLVFFHTVTPGISHVGIYAGNGKFVHASSRRAGGVRMDSLSSGYYSSAFRGARRVK